MSNVVPCRAATLAALLCLSAISQSSLAQTTINIGATRGNTLFQSDLGDLSGATAEWIFAGLTQAAQSRRGLLQFDMPITIPAGATITNVTLRMRMSRSIVGSEPVTIHRVTNSWTNGTSDLNANGGSGAPSTDNDVTWMHRSFRPPNLETGQLQGVLWNTPGGDFDSTALATRNVSGVAFYTWSSAALTADVQRWLNNPSQNFGWLIFGDETAGTSAKRFDGPGNSNAANRPSLSITYVIPTPGAAAIVGLGGLIALRRRR